MHLFNHNVDTKRKYMNIRHNRRTYIAGYENIGTTGSILLLYRLISHASIRQLLLFLEDLFVYE